MGLINKRTLVLGGLAVAAAAGAFKNRGRVAGLIGRGGAEPPSPSSATYAPPEQTRTPVRDEPAPAPAPANYDLGGPAENTATKLPAPEPQVVGEGGIDEAAEEAAAAAEAASIGGPDPAYAGAELGEEADDEMAPVVEAGGGESEGQEQAEALLQDYAEPSAGDPIEGGRQIEETLDEVANPLGGEQAEPLVREDPRAEAEQSAVGTSDPIETPSEGASPGTPGSAASGVADAAGGESARPTPATSGATTSDASAAAETPADDGTGERPTGDTPTENPLGGDQSSFFAPKEEGDPDEEAATPEGAGAGLPDQGAAEAAERAAGDTTEKPAHEKSSAVWAPPEKSDDDDDDGGEWQTWSGRAVQP